MGIIWVCYRQIHVNVYVCQVADSTEGEEGRGGGKGWAAVGCLRLSRVSKFREVVGNAIMRYDDGDDEEEGMHCLDKCFYV